MPVLDGLKLCQQLKANPETAGIPVIMLTARGHKVLPTELALTGIECFLDKPFSTRHLIAQINKLLQVPWDGEISAHDTGADAA